ncbi:MAG: S41 family peptidase [Bryobacteraceae bacterium]|jgi:carboxyl-terminal processing protease|nr:S41 family peptidase [Bryobacteraceae bacterium]
MKGCNRPGWVMVSFVALFALLGGVYGPAGGQVAAAANDQEDLRASLRTFSMVYDLVEQNFANRLDPERAIYKGAIPGMLRTLDPHSSFFDPRDYQLLKEDQRGHYFGVGMKVGPRNNKTLVVEVFTGSPAYRAGLRPGDVIVSVDGKSTEGLTTPEVADRLKGPRGTLVKVEIMREGNPQPLLFEIIRDEISRKSVPDAYWIRPGIAYLYIAQFNENTSREVDENLRRLGEHNIRGLILDLRGNPGGLLSEGVAVAERFLQKNQTIVFHRGRASAERSYVAKRGNGGFRYPIVVLVDHQSASAAEIVAGALQDHDRAWIMGDNTFGKGLVQTVYPLSENTGLALTTAKYYTPSGRLIQRDYAGLSFFDYYYRKNSDVKNPNDVRMTDSGRTVYGGGGIAPDEKVVPPKPTRFQIELRRKYAFFDFTSKYFGTRATATLPRGWEPDETLLEEFHQYLLKQGVSFTEAEFAEHRDWIRTELKREMYATAVGVDEASRVAIESDPVVAKAIEAMPKARALLENTRKLIVRRLAK